MRTLHTISLKIIVPFMVAVSMVESSFGVFGTSVVVGSSDVVESSIVVVMG